jgi:hypothetical protein
VLENGFRDGFLRAIVVIGVAVYAITEFLSVFGAIHRVPLFVCWTLVAIGAAVYYWRRLRGRLTFGISPAIRDPVVALASLGTLAIWALTAVAAVYSPPNSADAMAYHMPRVVYWAEQGSVRFFPTPFLNQIMLQPLAEYFALHSYVLSGGDHFVNFVQWFASVASVAGVSAIAALFGAGPRGQAVAALFCATLPSGILASSGAKNDYFMALWLVAAVYFAARWVRTSNSSDALAWGAALGLALLTKATVYLFAPWLLIAVLVPQAFAITRRFCIGAAAALLLAVLLNTPLYTRNLQLSGSILGFDSAHADGFFRWRNETFGWKQTTSNVLRNVSEQLGGRSEKWNHEVFDWTVRAHQRLGMDVNDLATTWRWTTFEPPRNANHEANANSKWHILVLWIAFGIAAWRAWRTRDIGQVLYASAVLCGFVAFCAYLKWQPFETRLFLPLLVVSSPLAGVSLDRDVPGSPSYARLFIQLALCLFLISNARRPVLENWVRPLKGPRSVLQVPRDDQYFADMVEWDNRATYKKTAQFLSAPECRLIGIDATHLSLEYPLIALLREKQPRTLFVHTGVPNVSSRFPPPVAGTPCAIICLDCAGDTARQGLYGSYTATTVDKFVVFRK